MSFGAPGGNSYYRPKPPDRGSFPLDHDGECTGPMRAYLACLQTTASAARVPEECRLRARDYLECRMQTGLMRSDEWKNLGLPQDQTPSAPPTNSSPSSPPS
ncbi:uncharacterized protein V1518DRAFT_414490 [Limtongia smithiae]|uniref:uncharacterized protein n=1 Tax=Limtongia smithiae TaxID=1125753 RepID=UPI0034CF1A0F